MPTDVSTFTDLALLECGREKCIPGKDITFTPKPYHLIHYVLSGKGFFEFGPTVHELKKGNLFYIPPQAQPKYYPDHQDPWIYAWIGFDGIQVDRLLAHASVSGDNPVLEDNSDDVLFNHFINLSDRYATIGILDIQCLGIVYQLIDDLISISRKNGTNGANPKKSHIKEAMEFVMYNYQFPIKVTDIADSLGITSNYLANIFTEQMGQSPKRYLTAYRMDKAGFLLKTGNFEVREIARMVGYKSAFHFSNEFKKHTGLSPTEYRDSR
jgi:AraC-like DNA-binding protein